MAARQGKTRNAVSILFGVAAILRELKMPLTAIILGCFSVPLDVGRFLAALLRLAIP